MQYPNRIFCQAYCIFCVYFLSHQYSSGGISCGGIFSGGKGMEKVIRPVTLRTSYKVRLPSVTYYPSKGSLRK